MRTVWLGFLIVSLAGTAIAQPSDRQQIPESVTLPNHVVVMSDNSSTVRVADPNELIGVNGRVMRIADYLV